VVDRGVPSLELQAASACRHRSTVLLGRISWLHG